MRYAIKHGPLDGATIEPIGTPLELWLCRPHEAFWVLDEQGNVNTDVRAHLYTKKAYYYRLFQFHGEDHRKTYYGFAYERYCR